VSHACCFELRPTMPPTPGIVVKGTPPFTTIPGVGGIVGLSSKQHAWLTMDLDPGKYALICFFPDPNKGGQPHVLEGMLKEVTIS